MKINRRSLQCKAPYIAVYTQHDLQQHCAPSFNTAAFNPMRHSVPQAIMQHCSLAKQWQESDAHYCFYKAPICMNVRSEVDLSFM